MSKLKKLILVAIVLFFIVPIFVCLYSTLIFGNFIYTGATKERTDKYTDGNKHSRHYDRTQDNSVRKVRSAKHRYIYFCTNSKRLKKEWLSSLSYPIIKDYPKGDNSNYVLGEYLQHKLIYKE